MPDHDYDRCQRCGHKFSKHYTGPGVDQGHTTTYCTKPECGCEEFKDTKMFTAKSFVVGSLVVLGIGALFAGCNRLVGNDSNDMPSTCNYVQDTHGGWYDC